MAVLSASFGILAPVTIIALPFALFAWRLLTNWRSRTRPALSAATTSGLDTGIVVMALEVLALTMMPVGHSHGSSLHLMPGSDILTEFAGNGSLWQIAGNLLLLAPLGVLVSLRFPALRSIRRITALAFGVSVVLELTQYLLHAGRVTSTDDVLLNTLGVAASATLSCGWARRPVPVKIPAQQPAPLVEAVSPRNAGAGRV
ncbi:VanZ family protein [Amycolatopsis alkalitolerans]|uniref:VanZ family protein n=1 Tax=Amycolatopsis alkalitolerans TaxID=2547244 RepID=A0A5C4M276_9PSEU|nr:VanZ family protein [Amycolatopsis alkalitolerans]TNC26124.1 VanZ family protein [Amycolatopsis alkalitolerans]